MHICILNPYFYPYHGGTEKVLLQVYKRLAKKHEISVITSACETCKDKSVDYVEGIKVVRLPSRYIKMKMLPLPFLIMEGLNEEIKRENAEIYHINNRFQYNMGNVKVIKSVNAKLALTIHNSLPKGIDFFTDLGGLYYDILIGRKIMHESDIITGVSRYAIESTIPNKDIEKSFVVYNGVDFNLFRPLNKNFKIGFFRDGNFSILNNGRLVKQKGQEVLLKSFAMLSKKYDANLGIIGKGPLDRTLHRMAHRLGVDKQFSIISDIKEEDLPKYYNMADLFVMPSLYEPAGMALAEALACETPSIATRIGGMPEIMGRCGMYIKPKDPNNLYSAMTFAIENQDYMKKLASEGRKRVIKKNDWDKIAKKYEILFSKLTRR
ncbi:MAG: glycosyltransferase family 4 protein [Candidatus Micrarchaeia archaeon]